MTFELFETFADLLSAFICLEILMIFRTDLISKMKSRSFFLSMTWMVAKLMQS